MIHPHCISHCSSILAALRVRNKAGVQVRRSSRVVRLSGESQSQFLQPANMPLCQIGCGPGPGCREVWYIDREPEPLCQPGWRCARAGSRSLAPGREVSDCRGEQTRARGKSYCGRDFAMSHVFSVLASCPAGPGSQGSFLSGLLAHALL
jgi:hypothetical protein